MLELSAMVLLDEFSNEASRLMPYLNTEMIICGNFISVVKTYWGVTHSRCTLQCHLLTQEYLIRPGRGFLEVRFWAAPSSGFGWTSANWVGEGGDGWNN